MFVEADGVCRPSVAKCKAGTIPKWDTGCVAVGIQGCAPMLVDADGICRPSPDKCPPGSIPKGPQGCVSVTIDGCAPAFVEGGLCRPGSAKCPVGTFATPKSGCVPIDGDGCGAAPWGDAPDSPTNVYVDATATATGADGTKQAPFPTLGAALAKAASGAVIVLAAGTYPEAVAPTKSVQIRGRCASMVTLSGAAKVSGSITATVAVQSGKVGLHGLTLASPKGLGIVVVGGVVTADAVVIDGASQMGVLVGGTGAKVSMSRSVIRNTLASSSGALGYAVQAQSAGAFDATATAFVGNRDTGLSVFDPGTLVTLDDVLIEGTLAQKSGNFGRGLDVNLGAKVSAKSLVLVGNHETSINVTDAGSTVDVTGLLVSGTLPTKGAFGIGVSAVKGASLTVTNAAIVDNASGGATTSGTGSTLSLASTLVARTAPKAGDGSRGYGVIAETGSHATLDGVALSANHTSGLFAKDAGTTIDATSVVAAGTLSSGTGGNGEGIAVQDGASLTLHGVASLGNTQSGLVVLGGGTVVSDGLLIEGTLPRGGAMGPFGYGILVPDAGTLTLTSTALLANRTVGLFLSGAGTTATADTMLVRGTLAQESDAWFGRGIGIESGAALTITTASLVDNLETGANARAGTISATGMVVESTKPQAVDASAGYGVVSFLDGKVTLASSYLAGNTVAGVLVWGATATVSGALVEGTVPGTTNAGGGMHTDVADGVLVINGGQSSLEHVLSRGNARSGFVFVDGTGTITTSLGTKNAFGLVVQGTGTPMLADGAQFRDNTSMNVVSSGALSVPSTPPGVPTTPNP
jgi:hypothetical protein